MDENRFTYDRFEMPFQDTHVYILVDEGKLADKQVRDG